MSQIEFVVQAGYTFVIAIRDPYDTYDSLASGLSVTEVVPGVYRCETGSLAGVVYVEAVAGALKVVGYANLDEPGDNGYSEVFDTLSEAEAGGSSTVNVAVLPGRDRAAPRSNKGKIVIAQNERITIVRQVVDGNGSPMNLSGMTLQFVIETAQGVDLAVIPAADITVSGDDNDSYSFVIPASASAKVGNFTYSLNDIGSSKAEVASGDWIVNRRAQADS